MLGRIKAAIRLPFLMALYMPLSDSLSELIIGGEADVTRCAVNNGTINIGVVGFIKQVVDVSLYGEIFRHLIAGKQIDQRIAACSARKVPYGVVVSL